MEKLEKIIKYLDGEVIGEEKISLENEIAQDPQMLKVVAVVKEVDQIVGDEDLVNFITKIDQIRSDFHLNPDKYNIISDHASITNSNSWIFNKKLAIAASIIIIAILSSIVFYTSKPLNEKLFNQYYTAYDASVITRSDNTTTDDLIVAIQLYDKKQYNEAIIKFDKILKIDHNNTAARFFISVSYMETKAFEKAIENLNQVIANHDTAFLEHAEWYLALCYIKTNQLKEAKKIIGQIKAGDSYYRAQASDLMAKLN